MNRFIKSLSIILLVIIIEFCSLVAIGQNSYNLVPNYSLEYDSLCTNFSLGTPTPPWYKPTTATISGSMSGCVSSCTTNPCCGVPVNIGSSGFQYARTGNSYGIEFFSQHYGQLSSRRGYLQVQLNTPLIAGQCYYGEFFVNLVNTASLLVNNVSMLLSANAVSQGNTYNPIISNPQVQQYSNPIVKVDTLGWTKIAAIFIAQGGEKYVTIGNFKSDANTDTASSNIPFSYRDAQYNIDDVSVMPIEQDHFRLEADAGPDTTVASGDSVFIGTLLGGTITTTWYDSSGNTIGTNVPGLYVSPTASTYYVLVQNMCTYTSRDTVHVTVGALPVKLLEFTGTKEGTTNLLKWRTATETNNRGFELQRSAGAVAFSTISFVPAKANGGNSTAELSYQFADKKALAAGSYYRLKQVDIDGKFSYSNIVFINGEPATELVITSLFPNPTHQLLNVLLQSPGTQNVQVIITDLAGKTVQQQSLQLQKGDNNKTVSVAALAKGTYLVKVVCGNGCVAAVSRFVKE